MAAKMVFREKCTVLNRFIRLQIKLACKLRSLGNSKTKKKCISKRKIRKMKIIQEKVRAEIDNREKSKQIENTKAVFFKRH